MSFVNVGEYAAAAEGGQNWFGMMNKAGASASSQGGWVDWSGGAGYPQPNYFASAPLTAATIASQRVPVPSVAPKKQWLHNLRVMLPANGATGTANQNQSFILCDYLMYYPFIDLVSTDEQVMDNTITLPRYTSGRGVRMMLVLQASNGNYATSVITIKYINQDGAEKTVSLNLMWAAYAASGCVAPNFGAANASNLHPFVPLAPGDSGVRAVTSVQLSADWGGLAAIVLVQPLFFGYAPQECRRTTTGNLDSFGSPIEYQNLIHNYANIHIEDGAFLGVISKCPNSVSGQTGSRFIAFIETVWN